MRVQINGADEDYKNVPTWIQYLLMTYRNSIGDISTPGYDNWMEGDISNAKKYTILSLIWGIWLFNQFLNLIILLNFLIAVISQVYDSVVADQKLLLYTHRAEMNREYYMIKRFFDENVEFKILVFSIDKSLAEGEADDWVGFVQAIKNFVSKQNITLGKKVDSLGQSLK